MELFSKDEMELILLRRAIAWKKAISCEPPDFPAAKDAILGLWKKTDKELPVKTVYVPGPTAAMMTEHFMENANERGLSLQGQFYRLKEEPLRFGWNKWRDKLGLRRREELVRIILDVTKRTLMSWTNIIPMPHLCGQIEWYWIALVKTYMELSGYTLGGEEKEILDLWEQAANTCGGWMSYGGMLIIISRPERCEWRGDVMNRDMRGVQLHCDGAPSIKYPDGTVTHHLNGIQVPAWIAETPIQDMKSEWIHHESLQSVDIRREFVRKIGVERLCIDLNATVIDRDEGYELLLLNLGDNRQRPYLKMLNPSIKVWHVEGVHPDCDTVKKALAWRNGTADKPKIIT